MDMARTTALIPEAALKKHIAPTETETAYAAGFFDGEGFITIAAVTRRDARGLIYTMRVGAAQNDIAPLLWLQERWHGSVGAAKRKTARHNTTHTWICCSRQAEAFLRAVAPHLIVKRERAVIALDFQDMLFTPGVNGHTAEYRERQGKFKERLNALNTHRPVLA